MTGCRVRYAVGDVYIGLNFGGLQHISTHRGMDHVDYTDVRFEHGLLQMTTEALGVLVRRGQEALATLPRNGVLDCSGALADIPEAGAV